MIKEYGCRYHFESLSSVSNKPIRFTETYLDVKKVLVDTFFGPPKKGVYSPSVQATLNYMAKAVLGRSLLALYFIIFLSTYYVNYVRK